MEIILIIIGIIIALVSIIKNHNAFSIAIFTTQITSLTLVFWGKPQMMYSMGFYLLGLSILLALVYPFCTQGIKVSKKVVIIIFLLPILLTFFFNMLNYPEYGLIKCIMFIPVSIYIYALIKRMHYKNEISFMTIFTIVTLIKLVSFFR